MGFVFSGGDPRLVSIDAPRATIDAFVTNPSNLEFNA